MLPGGAHKGTLVLTIGDWDAFKQKAETERVYSEPRILGGIQFTLEAFIEKNQWFGVLVRAAHPTEHPGWHSKAEFYLRWPRIPRSQTKACGTLKIFDNTSHTWQATYTLDVSVSVLRQQNNRKGLIDYVRPLHFPKLTWDGFGNNG